MTKFRFQLERALLLALAISAACATTPTPSVTAPPVIADTPIATVSPSAPTTVPTSAPTGAATSTPAPLPPPADPCALLAQPQALSLTYSAYASDDSGTSLYSVRADGTDRVEFLRGAYAGWWSPDGRDLVYLVQVNGHPNFELHLINAGSNDHVIPLDFDMALDIRPRWSPDGRYLALTTAAGGGIRIIDFETGSVTNPAADFAVAWGPVWSPNGQWIAFNVPLDLPQNLEYRVHVARPDGRDIHRLDSDFINDFVSAWYPDGDHLLITSGIQPGTRASRLSVDGSERPTLFSGQQNVASMALSPNGQQMVYHSSELHFDADRNITGSTQALVLAGADGSNPRILTQAETAWGQGGAFNQPQWSPDGRFIAFRREVPNRFPNLHVMDICTQQETQVAESIYEFSWKPGTPVVEPIR